ncbi:MAG: hypothetical protein ACJASQ_001058 [Crocinitomicaceae bacterium]|jgi:hypothetical protein
MNKAKESLEANMAAILESLPKEFHADLEKEVAATTAPPAPLSGEAEVAAIKAELVANPDVNESEAAAELTDIKAPAAIVPPTEAELEKHKADMLKEAEASTPANSED